MGDMAKSHGKEVSITEALTKELMEELNCNTVFTIPAFGGIKVPESVVVTWIIMALLILLSILLTRNLSIDNPGKVQLALESGYQMAESFFGELLGANGLKYLPYLLSVLLYIAVANLIGLIQATYKRYGCYRCNGRYEHCSGRSSRNSPKRDQRLVERFLGTNMDRSTDQSFGSVYQTIVAVYAIVW
jgi:F0F1-type ATP synthase membrane subunit a